MNPEAHEPAPVARDNVREGIFPRLAKYIGKGGGRVAPSPRREASGKLPLPSARGVVEEVGQAGREFRRWHERRSAWETSSSPW